MIKAQELRIGNLLTVDGIIGKADWIQKESISVTYLERQDNLVNGIITHEYKLDPISLTPEILEKCGFEFGRKLIEQDIEIEIFIYKNIVSTRITLLDIFDGDRGTDVKPTQYLHQLQNLYYALAGQELTYNAQ